MELKLIKKDTIATNWINYSLEKNSKRLCYFKMQQMLNCCGSSEIADFGLDVILNDEEKKFLFKKLQNILAKCFGTRNLLYRDSEDGHINKCLSNYFEKLTDFRNPNSGNILEIRSYTMSIEDWNELRPDEIMDDNYDDEDWEYSDDDDEDY